MNQVSGIAASAALLEAENEELQRAVEAARRNAELRATCQRLGVPIPSNTARAILLRVAKKHDVSLDDILGISRVGPIVAARQEAMHALRHDNPPRSFPKIGQILGRDHCTVIRGIRAHAKRVGAHA